MMKRILAMMLAALLLGMQLAGALAAGNGETTALDEGIMHVPFEDSYYGFCISPEYAQAKEGDEFTVTDTDGQVLRVGDGVDVSNLVKCAVIENFDELFRVGNWLYENADGTYYMPNMTKKNYFYSAVWWMIGAYTDEGGTTMSPTVRTIIEKATARAARETIGDRHTETYNPGAYNELTVTFDFKVFLTKRPHSDVPSENQQNFFAFRAAGPNAAPMPTATPKPTAEPTATPKPTAEPTATPKPTAEPTATPKPTPKPTAEPTATPKPTAEPTATPKPTAEPTATPKPTAEPTPTPGVTPTPTPTPTKKPYNTPVPPDMPDPTPDLPDQNDIDQLPKTGDDAPLMLFVGMLAASSAMLLIVRRKKLN